MNKSVGIIGAGFSGMATANIFKQYGFDVKVYEKDKEVGGVWTSSRRYPGLGTQNVKATYHLSDLKMDKSFPEWPSGSQVQEYCERYIEAQGLKKLISYHAEVTSTSLNKDKQWVVEYKQNGDIKEDIFDYLIVCNGIFSLPSIPKYEGADEFQKNGGIICHTSEFTDASDAKNKNIIVVGIGKSSCDVANAIADDAKSLQHVARRLIWKLPKYIAGLNFKYLFLTRMGENLIKYKEPRGFAKFLHGPGKIVRNFLLNTVEIIVARQLKLKKLSLKPKEKFESIAAANVSLATDGYYDKVENGTINFHQGEIVKLEDKKAHLSDGSVVDADIIICGTGWKQEVPFMEKETANKLVDKTGDYLLYKNQLPLECHNLGFNGYNSSFFSPTSSEIGALWLAEYFTGGLDLPNNQALRKHTDERLAWSKKRTNGKNSRGTNIIPFTWHHIDDLLVDIGMNLSAFTRFNHWNLPPSPSDYCGIIQKKIKQFNKNKSASFHS